MFLGVVRISIVMGVRVPGEGERDMARVPDTTLRSIKVGWPSTEGNLCLEKILVAYYGMDFKHWH